MKNLLFTILSILFLVTGSHLNAQTFTNYTTTDGLPDNFICGGVAVDTNNNKWFGTAAGVAKYDNSSWTVYTTTNGLIDNYTKCIAVDKNNNVWVGTDNGVSKFNGATWTSYTVADSLIDNGIDYIAGDIDGSIWFATTAGVSKLNGSIWTDYTTIQGLPTDVITYIAIDPSGNKWFGTPVNGVSIYDNSSFVNMSTSNMDSLADDNVNAIAFDKLGQKWLGTRYGITLLDNSNNWLTNYRPIDGLYNEWVQDIKVDINNNVWVALFTNYNIDGGISVFNGTLWQSFSVTEGLADKQVIRLAVDKNNDVWIATGNGVSKLSHTIGISTNMSERSFNVNPNPATDVVFISHGNNEIVVNIFNVTGKLIKSISLTSNENEININDVDPGMYILQITDNNNTTSRKLIKH